MIDPPLLAAAAGRDAAWVAARLAEAARVGVIVERGGRRRFGHALFREELYRELPEAERRALHGRVADALERLVPAQEAELAHHTLEGPPEMIARAVDHAIRAAGRAQGLLAYDEAVRTLVRARAAVTEAGNAPALRARVALALGQARIRRGEAGAGKEDCREAATIARTLGDAELGAQAALTYGGVFVFGIVDPVLVGMLEESLEALPPGDSALRARLLARLGAALQPSPRSGEPVAVAREAIATARRLGDPAALVDTIYTALAALMDIVDPAETLALNLELEGLVLGGQDRERLLRTHIRLALCHLGMGEVEACDTRIASFEALAAELRAPWYAWWAGMLRSVRATMQGRFDEAERLAGEARDRGRAAGQDAAERTWISTRESRLRTAERHDEMLAWDPESRRSRAVINDAAAWQAQSSALLHARLEHPTEARMYIDLVPDPILQGDNMFSLCLTSEAVGVCGPPDLATSLYERLLPLRARCAVLGMSYMGWEGPWVRKLALLAAYLERWDAASAHFEEAIGGCRRLGARPCLARTEYECGRALIARGDRERRTGAARLRARVGRRARDERPRAPRRREARGPHRATLRFPRPAQPGEGGRGGGFSFVREGEYWAIAHADTTFRLKDSLGIQYLVRLIEAPGREIHVLDLVGGGLPAPASTRRSTPATRASCWTKRRGGATSGGSRISKRPWPRPSRSGTRRGRPGRGRRSRCWLASWAGRSGWAGARGGRAGRPSGRAAPSSAGSRTPSTASASTTRPWARCSGVP